MSDPLHGVYRTKEEVEEQRKRDPITQLAERLKADGAMDDAALEALDAEAHAEVESALRFAEESAEPPLESLVSDVLAD
jgi:pyruvate dehydrogenase E1 component alpha subunit